MRAGGWLAGLLLAAGLVVPVPAVAATAQADLFRHVDGLVAFSPNGDGRRDVAQVHFRLTTSAQVTAQVRRRGVVLRTVRLGALGSGDHVLRWDGRSSRGRRVPDGRYAVVLAGLSLAGARDVARSRVEVDTVNCGRLSTTRPKVYPRATEVDDTVQLTFVECGWTAAAAERGKVGQAWTRLRVFNLAGKVVRHSVVLDQTTPNLWWDGRRDDGFRAHHGDYTAWVTTQDPAGNRRRFSVTIRVSDRQLKQWSRSFTMPAAEAATYVPVGKATKGVPAYCAPVPSTRFEGGLSFRPCDGPERTTREYFATTAPVRWSAPLDTFTIVARGGPTAPGETAVATLGIGQFGLTGCPPFDGLCSGGIAPVALDAAPYLPSLHTPVFWSFFSQAPNSYDIASFEITYWYWVPVR